MVGNNFLIIGSDGRMIADNAVYAEVRKPKGSYVLEQDVDYE